MIPIPDPYRLFPPKLPSSGDAGPNSLAEGLLGLGAFLMLLAGVVIFATLASNVSPWVIILAGLLIFCVIIAASRGLVFLGIIETIFYSGITFVFLGGLERANAVPAYIGAGLVAALFLWLTYAVWKKHR